ncbi:unnamed protein product [Arabidopsis arenosa]|uniref:Uncharacterized protein n=1 Tax=Arabidopsis arenosa TaxID=38785 RepID=A0A8S1ZNF5_ARAAE|nr:unnamed protein product [Arabidopsis arenosa]
MFESFEEVARECHFCHCCERSFTAEEEDIALLISKGIPQRVKASSTGEHLNVLAVESSYAHYVFQQLEKLQAVFEEYSKLTRKLFLSLR